MKENEAINHSSTEKAEENENSSKGEAPLDDGIGEFDETEDGVEHDDEGEPEIVVGYTLEEIDKMQSELEEAQAKAKENFNGWQRALADYSNLKRRVELERNEMHHNAVGSVVKPFLDVLDDLELALKKRPDGAQEKAWADGIELVYRKLKSQLDAQGLKVIEAEGEFFDPHYHEALSQEESSEHESGQIIEVVKPGYIIGQRVLRPALVRVAA